MSTSNDISPRDLAALLLPQAAHLQGGALAVGIDAVANGVAVQVLPYARMDVGDLIEVFWADTTAPVATTLVRQDQVGDNVFLTVPAIDIANGWAEKVYYRVTSADTGGMTEAPPVRVFVKLDPPEQPTVAPELPADIQHNGVGAEAASNGVPVTIAAYGNMVAGDIIRLNWGGQFVEHEVSDADVGQPVTITVSEAVILAAGDSDQLALLYEIRDVARNRSGWSPVTTVEVFAAGATLTAPLVKGANGSDFDYDALDGADAIVQVVAIGADFEAGDTIRVRWAGVAADGSFVDAEVDYLLEGTGLIAEIAIPNAVVQQVIGGSAVVSYKLLKSGGEELHSKTVTVQVHSEGGVPVLPAPTVAEAVGGTLAPTLPQAHVTVAAYPGMAVGDDLVLWWVGRTADGASYDYRDEVTLGSAEIGKPFDFVVPGEHVAALSGGTLEVYYEVTTVTRAAQAFRESERLKLTVGAVTGLPAPIVAELVAGVLDPDKITYPLIVTVPKYPTMASKDRIELYFDGSAEGGDFSEWTLVGSSTIGKDIEFRVEEAVVRANLDGTVKVHYTVTPDGGSAITSDTLNFKVEALAQQFPAPAIVEAVGDQLDPADVPNGATVRIAAAAALQANDLVTLRWTGVAGPGTTTVTHTVTAAEAGKELTLTVPLAVVVANDGHTVVLDYVVRRGGADLPASAVAEYDIASHAGSGRLLVMGARAQKGSYIAAPRAPQQLGAVDAETHRPLISTWRYAGETEESTGTRFRDTRPHLPLTVTSGEDRVTINPRNVAGNGTYSDYAYSAFAARRDAGNIVAWGATSYGGNAGPVIPTLDDIVEITGNGYAFAARRANGHVVAWGNASYGGNAGTVIPTLNDIVEVAGTSSAFAARRANGTVVAWGNASAGGDLGALIPTLDDIVQVSASGAAFAARRANGTVVAWGNASYGGNIGALIPTLDDIVQVTASSGAFVALRANGTVVAWGNASYGGNLGAIVPTLDDIVEVSSTERAFTARRANGTIVAWGTASYGGDLGALIPTLDDIVQVSASSGAFAALRANGTVVAWGDVRSGSKIDTDIAVQLTQVRAVYATGHAFAALTADGRVVTWGNATGGGNSSAVIGQLTDQVSYQATPASRGISRKARALVTL